MKVSIALTLDGLVRALRWKAHELAEAAELHRPEPQRCGPDRQEEARDDGGQR